MPTSGPTLAAAGASLTGIGTAAWTNPGNITTSNDTRATSSVSTAVSVWLVATFSGLAIPAAATIMGVVGTIEASYSGGTSVTITAASFVVADAVVGTQKTLTQALTTTDANYTVGGAADRWGYPITPAILNTSTTGFAVSMTGVGLANARVDAMSITVYYMLAGRVLRTRRVRRVNRH